MRIHIILLVTLFLSTLVRAENEIKSPWSFGYFGYYSSEMSDYHTGSGSIYSYHLFLVNYNFNDRFRLSVRPSITYNSGGTSYGEKIRTNSKASESQIVFIDKSPLPEFANIKSKATYKLYLPTDAKWQRIGTRTALGAGIEISKKFFDLLTVGFETKFVHFVQSQDTYNLVESDPTTLTPTLNQQFENTLKFELPINDYFSLSQAVGLKDQFYSQTTDLQSAKAHWLVLESMLNIIINDNIDFSLGVAQNADAESLPFSLYHDYESAYVFMASIRF